MATCAWLQFPKLRPCRKWTEVCPHTDAAHSHVHWGPWWGWMLTFHGPKTTNLIFMWRNHDGCLVICQANAVGHPDGRGIVNVHWPACSRCGQGQAGDKSFWLSVIQLPGPQTTQTEIVQGTQTPWGSEHCLILCSQKQQTSSYLVWHTGKGSKQI